MLQGQNNTFKNIQQTSNCHYTAARCCDAFILKSKVYTCSDVVSVVPWGFGHRDLE